LTNQKEHNRTLRWCAAGLLAYLLFSVGVGFLLAEASLHPLRRKLDDFRFKQQVKDHQGRFEDVAITAADGAVLRGWYAEPSRPNGLVVVLLHGVADNRTGVAGYAAFFLEKGYNVLVPDSRAHGESAGEVATYGLLERDDVNAWVSWLYAMPNISCVYGFGASMGAAIILQSLASEPRFCGVIAESAFSSFREAAYDRVGDSVKLGPWFGRTVARPAIEAAFLYSRLRYDVDFSKASAMQALQYSQTPVLLIHGADDTNIRPRHSILMHEIRTDRIKLWIVPGAKHTGAWATDSGAFESHVLEWLRTNPSPVVAPAAR